MDQADPKPDTIDAYIATFSVEIQAILQRIRSTVRKAAPDAEERISYRMPTFFQNGVILHFAAFKHHIGVFPPVRGDEALLADLAPYRREKGNLKFPLSQPIPYDLIRRIVEHNVKQKEAKPTARRTRKGT